MPPRRTCRVCWEGKGELGEFISPCKCKGTIKWVHKECWRDATSCIACGYRKKVARVKRHRIALDDWHARWRARRGLLVQEDPFDRRYDRMFRDFDDVDKDLFMRCPHVYLCCLELVAMFILSFLFTLPLLLCTYRTHTPPP